MPDLKVEKGDNLIYLLVDGKMTLTGADPKTSKDTRNYVIVNQFGDWSGFRTLTDCERQFSELEANAAQHPDKRIYGVVERL